MSKVLVLREGRNVDHISDIVWMNLALDKKIEFSFRTSGSAALDMAYTACGRYDGFFQRNLHLWDIAAGLILVKEAGGLTNEIDLRNNNDLKIIASSPNINEKLMDKISNF